MQQSEFDLETFIDPLSDFGFKKIFVQQENPAVLKDFLNSILVLEKLIVEITLITTEQLGDGKDDRKAVFDVHCKDETGNYFIIEVQKLKKDFFIDRSIYYSTFPIKNQGERGKWNFQLKKIYTICLLDFYFDDTHPAELFHEVKLVNTNTKKIFSDRLTLLYIELPKFKKGESELLNRCERWLCILKNTSRLNEIPISLFADPIFKQFFMNARKAHLTELELQAYYRAKMVEWDEYAANETAMKEGLKEGQLIAVKQVAKYMKLENESIEKIVKYTGLSAADVENL